MKAPTSTGSRGISDQNCILTAAPSYIESLSRTAVYIIQRCHNIVLWFKSIFGWAQATFRKRKQLSGRKELFGKLFAQRSKQLYGYMCAQ